MPELRIFRFPVRRISVLLSLGLLLAVGFLSIQQDDSPMIAERHEMISEIFNTVPDDLGLQFTWMKSGDVEIPTSQERMLDLNASISRRYQLLGSSPPSWFTFFLAHSSDARSMAGHHPPNCYPASGWLPGESGVVDSVIGLANGRNLPFRVYPFQRGDPGRQIWVVNGFVLPDGGGVGTLAEAGGVMGNAKESRLGLVQYQFVFDGEIDVEQATEFAGDILLSLPVALFDALSAPAPLIFDGVSDD